MNTPRHPLQWPAGWKRTARPVRSRFGKWNKKPSIAEASLFLEAELQRLTGSNKFILSSNLKYKADGLPYSNQKEPPDQGAAVYFKMADSTGGKDHEMTIACDSFDKMGCNIYAIALTIEAMRGISRWGCSELMNRAFTGFQALPEKASISSWRTVLEVDEIISVEELKNIYRTLCKKYHPDVAGGNAEKFIQVQRAYEDAIKELEVIA